MPVLQARVEMRSLSRKETPEKLLTVCRSSSSVYRSSDEADGSDGRGKELHCKWDCWKMREKCKCRCEQYWATMRICPAFLYDTSPMHTMPSVSYRLLAPPVTARSTVVCSSGNAVSLRSGGSIAVCGDARVAEARCMQRLRSGRSKSIFCPFVILQLT